MRVGRRQRRQPVDRHPTHRPCAAVQRAAHGDRRRRCVARGVLACLAREPAVRRARTLPRATWLVSQSSWRRRHPAAACVRDRPRLPRPHLATTHLWPRPMISSATSIRRRRCEGGGHIINLITQTPHRHGRPRRPRTRSAARPPTAWANLTPVRDRCTVPPHRVGRDTLAATADPTPAMRAACCPRLRPPPPRDSGWGSSPARRRRSRGFDTSAAGADPVTMRRCGLSRRRRPSNAAGDAAIAVRASQTGISRPVGARCARVHSGATDAGQPRRGADMYGVRTHVQLTCFCHRVVAAGCYDGHLPR